MKRAATIIVNEPIQLTNSEVEELAAAAAAVQTELALQEPGWMGRVAGHVLKQFRIFRLAVNRSRDTRFGPQ